MPALNEIMQDAGSTGLKALSAQAPVVYTQALLATHRADAARHQLGGWKQIC